MLYNIKGIIDSCKLKKNKTGNTMSIEPTEKGQKDKQ